MRIHGYLSGAFLAVAGLLAFEGTAAAQEDSSDPAPVAQVSSEGAAASADAPKSGEAEATHKKFSIELNPLSAAIGRYSLTAQFLPAVHHAIVLTPHFTHAPVTVTVNGKELDGGALNGFGAELGYRFYTGSQGANGFYIGPSFIFSSFSQSAPEDSAGTAGSSSFTAIGGAIDLGGQAIIGPGIVLGGGFGLQYTSNSEDIGNTDGLNLASAIIAGGGVRPRFLFTLGYAF